VLRSDESAGTVPSERLIWFDVSSPIAVSLGIFEVSVVGSPSVALLHDARISTAAAVNNFFMIVFLSPNQMARLSKLNKKKQPLEKGRYDSI